MKEKVGTLPLPVVDITRGAIFTSKLREDTGMEEFEDVSVDLERLSEDRGMEEFENERALVEKIWSLGPWSVKLSIQTKSGMEMPTLVRQ
ncbi:hypothetical protein L1887_30164 [Cichorium endivia]|nr:hypothetical protein L1887_30164 [Cichorium endivia]